ncbi:hypothetical protein MYE70_10705 [Marinobacter alexandrii]|uniref:hypothetical protein n=1 Tax=Marinobacter alexandrii TaxID=2570351 RepID=UPI001FFF954D|nr:hypothetical protein [Marinobacter alexandrii]MCK2149536.1 hypothetical protein [Marinobacter alexandrii]
MDLSQIKPIEKKYNLQNPATGKETGMILTLACSHDARVKKAHREANDKVLEAGKSLTEDQEQEFEVSISASYITGVEFTGDAQWKGATPKYSESLAREVCSIPALREQILFEVRKTKDFYKA